MFDDFQQWITKILSSRGYVYSRGAWVDTPTVAGAYIVAIRFTGGPSPVVDDRRQRFQVLLLGPRETRSASVELSFDADTLVSAAILGVELPCNAANVRAATELVGPGYTVEGRAWVQVDFEVLF